MSQSIYRTYRPQTFSEVVGQQHIVQTLSNAIVSGRIGQAYLFTGPRGTGKTTMARIFAKTINCQNLDQQIKNLKKDEKVSPCNKCIVCQNINEGRSLDIFEIDAASNTGVDNIRELRENVKFPPSVAKFKVYIIDEVHMLSTGAFNALLKTLEEPPAHVIFVLATTEIHKVPETIISRCQRFDFGRLSIKGIVEKLSTIAKKENVEVEKDALEMIAISAEGGMRDAESLFSQVIALEDKKITAEEVENILGTTKRQSLEQMFSFISDKDAQGAINLTNALSQDGYDLDVFNKSFLNYLRQAMLISVDKNLIEIFSHELTKQQKDILISQVSGKISSSEILFILDCFSEIQGKIRSAVIPQLPLEMAIVKSIFGELKKKQAESKADVQMPPRQLVEKNISPQKETFQAVSSHELKKNEEEKNSTPIKPEPTAIKTEPTPMGSGKIVEFSEIKRNWNRISEEIRSLNHSLGAVFPSCQLYEVENNTVVLATKFPFHKDKMAEQKNKLTLEEGFAKILGSNVRINIATFEELGLKQQTPENFPIQNQTTVESKETSSLLSDAMGIIGGSIVE